MIKRLKLKTIEDDRARFLVQTLRAKRCPTCEHIKLMEEFYKDRTRVDGREYYCKDCSSTKRRRYPNP